MGAREDGEAFGMLTLSASSQGAQGVALVMAWTLGMFKIIGDLDFKNPVQQHMAGECIERWGMVLPFTMRRADGSTEPRMLVGEQVRDLHDLFNDAWHLATQVRIWRPIVQMDERGIDEEETEVAVAAIRSFCRARTDWLWKVKDDPTAQVTCENEVFVELQWHTQRLMKAILGPRLWPVFAKAYLATLDGILEIRDLKNAPPQ